jgi:YjbE family integral membrane protein
MTAFTSFLLSLGGIILVDLILSGDNALIIGLVASRIEERRVRLLALIFGGLLAIFLRIVFTIFATFIIGFSYLQAISGLVILVIAVRLLIDAQKEKEEGNKGQVAGETKILAQIKRLFHWTGQKTKVHLSPRRKSFLLTMIMITIADITMSLDNIIAIGALAYQRIPIVVFGLLLSITLLLVSSGVVAELISRFSWLIIVATTILSCVASDLIWRNIHAWPFIQNQPIYRILLYAVLIVIVPGIAFFSRLGRAKAKRAKARKIRFEDTVHEIPDESSSRLGIKL